MFLCQISDLHFRSESRKLYDFIDINARNADVIHQITALAEQPDAIVITGDVVNCGRRDEYAVARRTLGYLRQPVYVIPGNHDDKAEFLTAFRDLCPALPESPECIAYAIDLYPAARLLFIDSTLAGCSHGWLSAPILDWLDQQLSEQPRETWVFMHHPPVALGSAQMDPIACRNGHELLQRIDRHPHLTHVFCGHVHRMIQARYKQALITCAPGTVHQVPYFHQDPSPYYNLEPAAMLMHRVIPHTGLVTYLHSLSSDAALNYLYQPSISCPLE